jgi:hypothetical protein
MNAQEFAEWLDTLSLPDRIRVLIRVYSTMTIHTRELFWPGALQGKEQGGLDMLHGVNEIHHTLANFLGAYADNDASWPPQVLSQQLLEIAQQYRIVGALNSAIESARPRD